MKKFSILLSMAFGIIVGMHANDSTAEITQKVQKGITYAQQQFASGQINEAFSGCRWLDDQIKKAENELGVKLTHLKYYPARERVRMYYSMYAQEGKVKQYLDLLENIVKECDADSILIDYMMVKSKYYTQYKTGNGNETLCKSTINALAADKDSAQVEDVFKRVGAAVNAQGNAELAKIIDKLHSSRMDSIQKAQELKLQLEREKQQQEENERQVAKGKRTVATLYTIIAILIVGFTPLLFFGFIKMKQADSKAKKLEKALEDASKRCLQQSSLLGNLSGQTLPIINSMIENLQGSEKAMYEKANAIKQMLEHMQEYAELEQSADTPYPTRMQNTGKICEQLFDKAKVAFKPEVKSAMDVGNQSMEINADALTRILNHLLKNAAKHTETGIIALSFKRKSPHTCQFIVTDTGCGIKEDLRKNLFVPFTEIHDLSQGSDGLGLPICNLIARKMNGEMKIDHDYHRGARIILELHS